MAWTPTLISSAEVAARGRWAALEPIRQGVRHAFAVLDARRRLNVEG